MTEQWGVGNGKDNPAFAKTHVRGREVELFFGEHPHSRRDDREYARFRDGSVVAFDGFRVLVDVQLKSQNYKKESELSGDEIRKSVCSEIFMNSTKVYEVGGRDVLETLLETRQAVKQLFHLPVHVWDEKELKDWIGKPLAWNQHTGVCAGWYLEQGCVYIKLPNDPEDRNWLKIEILDGSLRWFPE